MGKLPGAADTILRIRQKALARLLPDTCKIYNNKRRRTPSGSTTEYAPIPVLYHGVAATPCRLDIARFFRSGSIENQAVTVNDYELHLPYDAELDADWRVEIAGNLYEVRKDMGDATNTITKIYLITRLDTIKNPIPTTPAP